MNEMVLIKNLGEQHCIANWHLDDVPHSVVRQKLKSKLPKPTSYPLVSAFSV